jgi:Zn-dependent M32 family carboxypeptidase
MPSAKEIFDHYFNKGTVVTNQQEFENLVVIPAMEAYRRQSEEAAFNAARLQSAKGEFDFRDYTDYKTSLIKPTQEVDALRAHVEAVADTILQNYIPADKSQTRFSFTFNTEGARYEVEYKKDASGYWYFAGYQEEI